MRRFEYELVNSHSLSNPRETSVVLTNLSLTAYLARQATENFKRFGIPRSSTLCAISHDRENNIQYLHMHARAHIANYIHKQGFGREIFRRMPLLMGDNEDGRGSRYARQIQQQLECTRVTH